MPTTITVKKLLIYVRCQAFFRLYLIIDKSKKVHEFRINLFVMLICILFILFILFTECPHNIFMNFPNCIDEIQRQIEYLIERIKYSLF